MTHFDEVTRGKLVVVIQTAKALKLYLKQSLQFNFEFFNRDRDYIEQARAHWVLARLHTAAVTKLSVAEKIGNEQS